MSQPLETETPQLGISPDDLWNLLAFQPVPPATYQQLQQTHAAWLGGHQEYHAAITAGVGALPTLAQAPGLDPYHTAMSDWYTAQHQQATDQLQTMHQAYAQAANESPLAWAMNELANGLGMVSIAQMGLTVLTLGADAPAMLAQAAEAIAAKEGAIATSKEIAAQLAKALFSTQGRRLLGMGVGMVRGVGDEMGQARNQHRDFNLIQAVGIGAQDGLMLSDIVGGKLATTLVASVIAKEAPRVGLQALGQMALRTPEIQRFGVGAVAGGLIGTALGSDPGHAFQQALSGGFIGMTAGAGGWHSAFATAGLGLGAVQAASMGGHLSGSNVFDIMESDSQLTSGAMGLLHPALRSLKVFGGGGLTNSRCATDVTQGVLTRYNQEAAPGAATEYAQTPVLPLAATGDRVVSALSDRVLPLGVVHTESAGAATNLLSQAPGSWGMVLGHRGEGVGHMFGYAVDAQGQVQYAEMRPDGTFGAPVDVSGFRTLDLGIVKPGERLSSVMRLAATGGEVPLDLTNARQTLDALEARRISPDRLGNDWLGAGQLPDRGAQKAFMADIATLKAATPDVNQQRILDIIAQKFDFTNMDPQLYTDMNGVMTHLIKQYPQVFATHIKEIAVDSRPVRGQVADMYGFFDTANTDRGIHLSVQLFGDKRDLQAAFAFDRKNGITPAFNLNVRGIVAHEIGHSVHNYIEQTTPDFIDQFASNVVFQHADVLPLLKGSINSSLNTGNHASVVFQVSPGLPQTQILIQLKAQADLNEVFTETFAASTLRRHDSRLFYSNIPPQDQPILDAYLNQFDQYLAQFL